MEAAILTVEVNRENGSSAKMAANEEDSSDIESEIIREKALQEELTGSESDNEEIAKLKSELSTIPFCELQALRDKIGVRKFNEALHGHHKNDKQEISRSLKRKNKNRPREISSKKPVSRFKQVVPTVKKVSRDPRFDDLSGRFNENMFEKAYSFLDDIRTQEKQEVKKALKLEKDHEKKAQLHSLYQRMEQAEKAKNFRKIQKEKRKERKLAEVALLKQGKKPFYLKKSERKKLELAEKYKSLKESKKLDQYLNKKRKKNAVKERRRLPKERE